METSLPNCGDAFSRKEILGERAAKLFAFWAIVAATVAAISAAVALPALYSTAHRLRAELSRESDFCRLQVRDFWLQMYALGVPLDATLNRLKRDTGADDKQNESALKRRKRGWLFGTWRNDDDAAIGVNSDPYGGGGDSESRANDGYGGMGGGTSRKNGYDNAPSGYGSSAGDNVEVGLHIVREGLKSSAIYDAFPIYGGASPPGASPPSISPPAGVAAARPQFVARTTPVCPCQCQQGAPGPAGEPGDDGKAGADGRAGAPGDVGRHGQLITPLRDAPKEPCIICPVGPPGPPGGQGPRGPTGPRGTAGTSGIDGRRGEPGMQGPPGPIGVPGVQGPQGPQGIAGRQFMRDGSRGPAGKPGPPGPKGLQGCQGTPGGTVVGDKGAPGDPGRPGHDGHKGVQGPDGLSGPKGISGDCQHCPIPRTPPGY